MRSHTFSLCAALLLCGLLSARAVDVEARILLTDGTQAAGTIRWIPVDKVYAFGAKDKKGLVTEKRLPADSIVRLQVKEPTEWKKLQARARQSPDAAVSDLVQLAERYRMLQWDGEAGAAIAQIYLKKNNAKGAIDACRKIIQGNDRAAWDSAMAPWYWRSLIDSNQTSTLPDLLEKGATSSDRYVAAQAYLKRGDMLEQNGQFRNALTEGYLRVVILFQDAGEARAEAVYKAARIFDKFHQVASAERMRKILLVQYNNSPWTKQFSSAASTSPGTSFPVSNDKPKISSVADTSPVAPIPVSKVVTKGDSGTDESSGTPRPVSRADLMIASGTYRSESSQDVLEASPDGICIRNGKSTWARLPNDPTGKTLFDRDDLARSWPQRLRLLDNGKVEHTKDAKPPFPEQKLVFVPDEGGQP